MRIEEGDGMMKRIWERKELSLAIRFCFRLLDYIWPKNRNLVVFCGQRDLGYADNSRYLFERFLEVYGGEFEILWVTRIKDMLDDVSIEQKARDRMVYMYSANGILALLRAKTIFFSWGLPDLPGTAFSKRTMTIQLWHGIPIKRIGLLLKNLSKREASTIMRDYCRFTYWICSSKIERNSIALCTGLQIDDVKITGYPRNDYLIEHKDSRDAKMLKRFPFLDKLVLLYAPTYRRNGEIEFFPFDDFEIEKMNALLEEKDAYLILRTHFLDDDSVRDGTDHHPFGSERIVILNRSSVRDIQEILPYVDVLISDYSGIWMDFLLLDRPIVFVPYDLESYEENEGLLYSYHDITPGPKVLRFDEFLRALNTYAANPLEDSDMRCQIKRIFHEFEDGKAYERIYQLIKDELS